MKVLVTGANGFLGSWLTRALVNEGHEVSILVRPTSNLSELKGLDFKVRHGDVTDIFSLSEACVGMDAVFHLAGVIAYKKNQRTLMEKVNVEGTRNVVEVCKQQKIKRLVYLSSVTAIGASFSPNEVLNEESEYRIHNLNLGYFETKKAAEDIVVEACKNNEIDAVILCPSTIYGAGDAKKGSRGVQVKVAQQKFKFYTSGGVSVVAVEDVIDGILKAWKNGKKGERYILSGENLTIQQLFTMIANEAGVTPPKVKIPNFILHIIGTIGDLFEAMGLSSSISSENAYTSTMYHWFDSSKAKKELGFNPRPAKEAIHSSVQWMKDNGIV